LSLFNSAILSTVTYFVNTSFNQVFFNFCWNSPLLCWEEQVFTFNQFIQMLKQFLESGLQSSRTVNVATLWLRLGLGIAMIPHGYDKFIHYAEYQTSFMRFLGLSDSVSLTLAIGAELVCSILLMMGLLTRLVLIPLIITALVIVFVAHEGDIIGEGAAGFVLLIGYVTSLLLGPGAYSLDAVAVKSSAS
jgi:putative oxidoreductase